MAHKETIQNIEIKAALPGVNHIYTVSTNVGYGYRNMSEDVRLVQFFINVASKELGSDWPERPAKLATDGDFGGKTWAAIKSFQRMANSSVDGMVSPVDGNKLMGRNSRLVYAMYYLNWYYWLCRPQLFTDIRSDPELPVQLKAYLSGPMPNYV